MVQPRPRVIAALCVGVGLTVTVSADTLVLRDGRRVRGALVGVRGDTVEFEGQRGFFGRETVRVDRRDILRIEFEDDRDERARPDDRDGDGRQGRRERPAGLREREVRVDARSSWTDTGVTVRAGQTVFFAAGGRVHWGPGRDDGPGGESGSPRNEGRPMPARPAAALIGRLGTSNDYFYIGDDDGPIRMRDGGRLFLGINDDYLQDNNGSLRVTVFY